MAKEVIHIYGASGSGTSTLGRYLGDKLGYFFMDTDDYFWLPKDPPYTKKRDKALRLEMMKHDLAQTDKAVISGSLVDWGDELIPLFTLALRLKTNTELRIKRLKQREREHFGSRIDVGGDMYENHQDFLQWAAAYDSGGLEMRSSAKHDDWEKLLQCKKVVLDGSRPLEENLEIIRNCLR